MERLFCIYILVSLSFHNLISFVPMKEYNFHSPSHGTLVCQLLFNKNILLPQAPRPVCDAASHLKHYSSTSNILRIELDHLEGCNIHNFFTGQTYYILSLSPDCHKMAGFSLTALHQFIQCVEYWSHWREVSFSVNHNCKPIKTANHPLKKGRNGYVAMVPFSMSFPVSKGKVSIPAVVVPN